MSAQARALQCAAFPNTMIHYSARRIGQGEFRGYFRGYVRTVERSAWLTPCVSTFPALTVRTTREDALSDARTAATEAAATGYVPESFGKAVL